MINRSFYLLRTNPLLTTNIKLIVTSDYKMYMESFNSNSELNNIKYKHFPISKNEYLENKIPEFYKKLPIDIAFDVKYDNDNKVIMNNFENQFDTIYYAGASYIQDQWYTEEFEYLAPLYIRKNNLPKGFIVLRVDDPSDYNLNNNNDFELSKLENSNFYSEVVNNWKCVKFFDMTYESDLGKWLYSNYVNNDRYPKTAFEYHPERTEFSNWYGMDYTTGIYTYKPLFMEDRNEIETPHFRFEKYITEGYKRSNLIFPYILNLNFLFDDTPATPTKLKKYSINRYYGFYVDDLEFVSSITSYVTPEMVQGTYLVNNIIVTGDTGYTFDPCNLNNTYYTPTVNPFKETWDDSKNYYVFIDNTNDFNRDKTISGLYPVKKTIQDGLVTYKVISDDIMDNYWNTGYTNIKTVNINYSNFNIVSGITSDFFIDKYVDCNGSEKYMYGDLYLININGNYHVIKYSSGITFNELNVDNMNDLIVNPVTGDIDDYKYYIQSDYAINLDSNKLEYWILGKNSQYYKTLSVESTGQVPLTFPIYRLKFTDVKDFDFDRVNTDYSNFDYEKTAYISTDEEKLYTYNYNDDSIPPSKKVEREGSTSQYRISNVSSEYIADDELYEIYDLGQQLTTTSISGENRLYDLTDIWRKNQSVCKWGFTGSVSHSDYPYKLNNNYEAGGVFNRTVDPFTTIPNTNNKNMDYFYRIGNFYESNISNVVYYKNQTTNIQSDFIKEDLLGSGFDLKVYFQDIPQYNINFDYFTYFFKNKELYESDNVRYSRSYDKYSVFSFGDDNVNSITLFKGLKVKIKEIKNIYSTNNQISDILYGNKNYNDYKFSIILNENYDGVDNGLLNNDGYIDTLNNGVNIILNEKYKNILVIINSTLSGLTTTLNDIDIFDEKEGLYYGKRKDGTYVNGYNPSTFNSTNFINALNNYNEDYNLYVRYYYIKEIDGVTKYGKTLATRFSSDPTGMKNIWSYDYQPFMLKIETPIGISLNNNCYSTVPFYVNSVDDDYVGTMLQFDSSKSSKTLIYRFPGPYEPIFKDVNIFKSGYFCYNDISTGSTTYTGNTYSISTTSNQPPSSLTSWEGISNLCSNIDSDYVYINCPNNGTNVIESNKLFVYNFDFSVVPNNAIITGITLEITRKSNTLCSDDLYVRDKQSGVLPNGGIQLAKNVGINTTYSSDEAPYAGNNYWSNELTTISYPLSGNLNYIWGFTSLTGSDVKSKYFGAVITVQMKNNTTPYIILPQIKCVKLTLRYEYQKSYYETSNVVYFDNNLKFDTELNDFGKIDELVFSKVNDKLDILNDLVDKYRIYPVIDEYGYDYTSRFIFKSSWDKEFFTKTEKTYLVQTGNI